MKMPLITASHLFALSAGIRPGKAVFSGFAVSPHVAASFEAMSTSKPVILPLDDAISIGGEGGAGAVGNVGARRPAPARSAAGRGASQGGTGGGAKGRAP